MRVLMVTPALPSAAQPNTMASVASQIKSLRALGVDVEVLEIKGAAKFKYLQSLPRLRALASRVDLLHAHFGFCGWLARCQFRKPVVVSFMGVDLLGTPDDKGRVKPVSRLVVRIDRWSARTMNAVIVKSEEMARVVKPVSAYVLPNGVDLDMFRPMDAQKARTLLQWPRGRRYILFPGDPDNPRKGFPLAQAAVARASQQIAAPLTIVPLKHVPPERVALYMNACDAMILTSFIEGSPNVVKEAMGCNLPVISVPVGDVPEQLARVEGCSVVPRDADALATALVATLVPDRRTNGREALMAKGLDLMTVARRLMEIYAHVLAEWDKRAARPKATRLQAGQSL